MECNKDEAARCRQIAERKLGQNDASGAKKFAYKARQLYPELDGLSQLISVLEVHSAAAASGPGSVPVGDSDWYGILQVDHSADEATIRKQYRKLALLLHPDKNQMQGAEAAFKLVSEAWSVLSDKPKKAAYDMRRTGNVFSLSQSVKQSRAAAGGGGPPPPPTTNNGFCSFARTSAKNQRPPAPPPPPPSTSKPLTFWTSCPSCKMQYEYLRIYENRNLCCPMCRQPFLAKETPIVGAHTWRNAPEPTPPPPPPGFRTGNGSVNSGANFSWGAFKSAAATEQVVRETFEKVKRERVEAQKELKKKELKEKDQKKKDRELQKAQEVAKAKEVFVQMMAKARSVFEQKPPAEQASERKAEATPPPSNTGNRNIEELSGASSKSQSAKLDSPVPKKVVKQPGNGKRKVASGGENDGSHPSKKIRAESPHNHVKEKKPDNDAARNSSSGNLHPAKTSTDTATDDGTDTGLSKLPSVSVDEDAINVPDPDFYDFDKDRMEKHFAAGQVWAVYDESNGMPRFYARINKVFSSQPFKIHMSWLEPRLLSKDAQVWLKFGLQCPCGEFRIGKSQTSEHVNTFSHLMEVGKGQKGGSFKIYPRKGEIWALYKGWNEALQPQDVTHIYDVVEMLSDFREGEGVSVAPLSKTENYTAVFRKGEVDAFSVSARELLRFSHQVPAHQLTAEDANGSLEGCWELDPAAIPPIMITSRGGD